MCGPGLKSAKNSFIITSDITITVDSRYLDFAYLE